jgi:hypothetical protein
MEGVVTELVGEEMQKRGITEGACVCERERETNRMESRVHRITTCIPLCSLRQN